ncbi:prephenate dehydrogenase [Vallitalea okinawensis]|uniref:prephenate dehydrogenase n=1 Tax=Vallitalea okinawensis TaxID=2078660 RepID=UPI000CFD31E1|nr:prephenate dehydrogenase [Vallitalea okinawensis]
MQSLNIGIIGLGLIGGSLAKAIKRSHPQIDIVAFDQNEKSLLLAKEQGIINSYTLTIDSAFSTRDIIFLCLPVEKNQHVISQLTDLVNSQCILTDVGSTKNSICEAFNNVDLPCTFIGGHPMTGSEKSGFKASKAYLFENAYYILCPNEDVHTDQVALLKGLIESFGALVIIMDAKEHDYVTSAISHVPHVVASSLVAFVESLDEHNLLLKQLAAGGFKDITRIASSSPEMWQSICLANSKQIEEQLDVFMDVIRTIKKFIQRKDEEGLSHFFQSSKIYRDSFKVHALDPLIKTYELRIDVEDQPGTIAQVATLLSKNNLNIKNIGIVNNREHERGILEIIFYDKESRNESATLLQTSGYNVYY